MINAKIKYFAPLDDKIIERIAYIKHRVLDFIRAAAKSVWDAAIFWFLGEERLVFHGFDCDYSRILYFAETHKEVIDSLHMTSSFVLIISNHVIKILTVFIIIFRFRF